MKISKLLTNIVAILLLSFAVSAVLPAFASTLRVVQTPKLSLYAGISSSAVTMRITPYPKDLDGTKLTMTDFGTLPTVTIDPGIKNIEEIVGFTAITDNGDNTATLTGLARDIISKYPYTTTGTGRAHNASAVVVFGNNPQIYGRLAAMENINSWTGQQTFSSTSIPQYATNTTRAQLIANGTSSFATLDYVNNVAVSGAADATEGVKGLVQAGTAAQQASSTALGSTGAMTTMRTAYATDTPQAKCNPLGSANGAGCSLIAQLAGKISQVWLDIFTTTNTWAGPQTFSGTATATGNVYGFSNQFGNGTDGASTTASSYTLTRDYYFTNYTVSVSNVINTGNYKIFVSGILTVNGTINNNGNAGGAGGNGVAGASGGTAGAAGTAGSANSAGSFAQNTAGVVGLIAGKGGSCGGNTNAGGGSGGSGASGGILGIYARSIVISGAGIIQAIGGAGGNGGSGSSDGTVNACGSSINAANGTAGNVGNSITSGIGTSTTAITGAGGAGGSGGGSGGSGGASANAGTFSSANALPNYIVSAIGGIDFGASSYSQYKASSGGASGGSGGGGGGGGAGVTNGGGGGGAGAAGGAGGAIILVYSSLSNSGTISVTGGAGGTAGAGGTGGNTGTAGAVGTAGNTGTIYQNKI